MTLMVSFAGKASEADRIVFLAVAHTVQDSDDNEVVRIIPARKASPSERRRYANQETEKGTRSPRCNAG
jgi:uncharacterized DUF497 family protein